MSNSEEEYLTIHEAMERLGVKSRNTIYLWKKQGLLTSYERLGWGNRLFYKKSEVEKLAAEMNFRPRLDKTEKERSD